MDFTSPELEPEPVDNGSEPTVENVNDVDDIINADANDKVGDEKDCTHDGKVKKIILEVGEGKEKPRRSYIAKVIYKLYFFDHEEIESSKDQIVEIELGDITWPEGLSKGIEEMRKGESAKIKIKKKYGFGRKEHQDKLRFPEGFQDPEKHKKLLSKGIIYEVKLVDWIERVDVLGNGDMMKSYIERHDKGEWEFPKGIDELVISIKVYQNKEDPVFQKDHWKTNIEDKELTPLMIRVLESVRRQEHSVTQMRYKYVKEKDAQMIERFGSKLIFLRDVYIEIQLHSLTKLTDWYKDGTTFRKILRKVSGSVPKINSYIKLRMKITVNGNVVVDNFEGNDPLTFEDPRGMSKEEKQKLFENPTLFTIELDSYILPSPIKKAIKQMSKGNVIEFTTTRIKDLQTNFPNHVFDAYKLFKEGDQVTFIISLVHFYDKEYFYKMKIADKLARVLYLKDCAGKYFKLGLFKKSAKIYQQINSFYNFGDSNNNGAQEDEETEEYKKIFKELWSIKLTSFLNLVVCKSKLKENASIISITDQILEMDPNNIKCLYFRGKALVETQEYNQAVDCLKKLVLIDPNHAEGKAELARAIKVRKDVLEKQSKAFSKFFQE